MRIQEYETSLTNFSTDLMNSLKEPQKLFEAEDHIFLILVDSVSKLKLNQFVATATSEGLSQYEKQFNILSDPATERLEVRRTRIIELLSTVPPYTLPAFRQKLQGLIGDDNFTLVINYTELKLYITTHITVPDTLNTIIKTAIKYMPANIKGVVSNIVICYTTDSNTYYGIVSSSRMYNLS